MIIRRLVKKNIRMIKPYQATELECRVKLDANESPYGFGEALAAAEGIETNRYPDPEAGELRKTLAGMWGVRESNILHGNGSDELIYYLVAVFGGPVMYPRPTFSMYGIIAGIMNEETAGVPLGKGFQLNTGRMVKEIREKKPRLIFLSSPNNPTGNCFERDSIIKLIKAGKGIVVVDEAYQPFSSQQSFVKLIKEYPRLVVMRTLSKVGLAALRSGFIVAQKDIIDEVNKARLPFNVNSLSQAVAMQALGNRRKFQDFVNAVVEERHLLFDSLDRLEGVQPFPTDANFILFRVNNAEKVYKMLLARGVLVRNVSDAVKGCLRVTVGRPEENRIFVNELSKILKRV